VIVENMQVAVSSTSLNPAPGIPPQLPHPYPNTHAIAQNSQFSGVHQVDPRYLRLLPSQTTSTKASWNAGSSHALVLCLDRRWLHGMLRNGSVVCRPAGELDTAVSKCVLDTLGGLGCQMVEFGGLVAGARRIVPETLCVAYPVRPPTDS
jgi:hypothetical protein